MDKTRIDNQTIEVITSVQRRRRWTPSQKRAIVEETYQLGGSVSSVARAHGISPSQLFQWKRHLEDGALTGVGSEQKVIPESELKKAEERIRRLERLLGKKTEEVEILKEAVEIGRKKKLISQSPLRGINGFE